MTPKQRVVRAIEKRYGDRPKPRLCVTGHDKLIYVVIGMNTVLGKASSARAAWADAASKLSRSDRTDQKEKP